jgi:hypothetical protein
MRHGCRRNARDDVSLRAVAVMLSPIGKWTREADFSALSSHGGGRDFCKVKVNANWQHVVATVNVT